MPTHPTPQSRRRRIALIGATALCIFLIGAAFTIAARSRATAAWWVDHTHMVLRATDQVVGGLVNAETAQRGFVLTGREPYLEPYQAGRESYRQSLQHLRSLTADNPTQQRRLDTLAALATAKLQELDNTIDLRRSGGLEAAAAMIGTDRGKAIMDSLRQVASQVQSDEQALLAHREQVETRRQQVVILIAVLGTVAGVLLVLALGGSLSKAVSRQAALSEELADRARELEETATELEMSNEELQRANERLQYTVEELQTTTEELETANLELGTANDDLLGSRTALEARQGELDRSLAALAQSEARFRSLAEHLPIPVVMCRPDGRTEYVNPAWTLLTGLALSDVAQSGWEAAVHPDDVTRVRGAWSPALTGERVDLQYRVVRPDGALRHVRTTSEAMRGSDGHSTAILGISMDLTERFEHEEQLRHAQRMQAVGRLAGGMAHELNNMLTASIGFNVYALRSLPADHPAASEIGESLKAQERAARITSQVLSFSRRQMLEPTTFDLNDAVRELAPLLRQSLAADQRMQLDLSESGGSVHADRTRMDQALLNLTLNARDAMPGGGSLIVRTATEVLTADALIGPEGERPRPGRYLSISFEDQGAGMDAETRRRAVEPFFTTKPVGHGTGLGLSMAYGFVRQSGGTMTLESEPGRGTKITLYLPLAATPHPDAGSSDGRLRLDSPSGEHVLVVDDEPTVRTTMRRALEEQGYIVAEAGSGSEALSRLQERAGKVHLVVCDLVMPEMSGSALGAAIREQWPIVPVLYVSGFPGADGAEVGMMPPGAPFLRKPFLPDALAAAVRAVLDRT
ncbi:MAG TPA: CHASE3 domain-containing protein [Gemmatimonadales bacterium]|nr:CHASE3 domain-containing protein [Gemmatimonadales bacterium]